MKNLRQITLSFPVAVEEAVTWKLLGIDICTFEELPQFAEEKQIRWWVDEGDKLLQTLSELFCDMPVVVSVSEPIDPSWEDAWLEYSQPVLLGEQFAFCRPSQVCEIKNREKIILIEPGLSFGTGEHESTRLILGFMSRYIANQPAGTFRDAGPSFLDVGCGSGILSIFAKILGCEKVVGVDCDSQAVLISKKNAELNLLPDCSFSETRLENLTGSFDFIAANMLSSEINPLWEHLLGKAHSSTKIFVSGLLSSEQSFVQSLKGVKLLATEVVGEWLGAVFSLA